MPIASISTANFGNLQDVMDLARSIVADTLPGLTGTPGEGQILTNDPNLSPFTLNFVNSALRSLYRALGNSGIATVIKDNVIISGLTPVNSSLGVGTPNPAVQVQLAFGGYFDGVSINAALVLPADFQSALEVSWRQTGSGLPFQPLQQVQRLESRNQTVSPMAYEVRGDSIWMVGSTDTIDIRIRYIAALPIVAPGSDFEIVTIPVVDCVDYLAFRIAYLYTLARDAEAAPTLRAEAEDLLKGIKLRQIRSLQAVNTQRVPYGSDQNGFGNSGNRNGF